MCWSFEMSFLIIFFQCTYFFSTEPFGFGILFREFCQKFNLFVLSFFHRLIFQWSHKIIFCLQKGEKLFEISFNTLLKFKSILHCRNYKQKSYLFHTFQIAPVWITLIFSPFGILAFSQQSTKVCTSRFRNVQLRFIGNGAVTVCKDDFVFAFITRFDIPHTKCNCIGCAISVEFIANTFNKWSYTFVVKLECWCRCTLNLYTDVSSFT